MERICLTSGHGPCPRASHQATPSRVRPGVTELGNHSESFQPDRQALRRDLVELLNRGVPVPQEVLEVAADPTASDGLIRSALKTVNALSGRSSALRLIDHHSFAETICSAHESARETLSLLLVLDLRTSLVPSIRAISEAGVNVTAIFPTVARLRQTLSEDEFFHCSVEREAIVKLAKPVQSSESAGRLEVREADLPLTTCALLTRDRDGAPARGYIWPAIPFPRDYGPIPLIEAQDAAASDSTALTAIHAEIGSIRKLSTVVRDRGALVLIHDAEEGEPVADFAGFGLAGDREADLSVPVAAVILYGWAGSAPPRLKLFLYKRLERLERDAIGKLGFVSGVVSERDVQAAIDAPVTNTGAFTDELAAGKLASELLQLTGSLTIPDKAYLVAATRECATKLCRTFEPSRFVSHQLPRPAARLPRSTGGSIAPRLFSLRLRRSFEDDEGEDEVELIERLRPEHVLEPVSLEELLKLPGDRLNDIILSGRSSYLPGLLRKLLAGSK